MVEGLGKELLLRVSGEMEEPPPGSLKAGQDLNSFPFWAFLQGCKNFFASCQKQRKQEPDFGHCSWYSGININWLYFCCKFFGKIFEKKSGMAFNMWKIFYIFSFGNCLEVCYFIWRDNKIMWKSKRNRQKQKNKFLF